jgi:hypothetical protein
MPYMHGAPSEDSASPYPVVPFKSRVLKTLNITADDDLAPLDSRKPRTEIKKVSEECTNPLRNQLVQFAVP